MLSRLNRALSTRVDGAGLRAFRLLFGLIATVSALRFVAMGWVQALYLEPGYHFAWVPWAVVPSAPVLYALFAALAVAGVGIAFAREYRGWLALWLLCFVYIELLDKALYLNHYVLMTLLGMTLFAARPNKDGRVSAWVLWLLRIEVALVYLWAGLCKINADWLLRGEPLTTWLSARSDLPLLGAVFREPLFGLFMSWGGCLYDLGIAGLLLWPRSRPLAIALVVFFHGVLGLLFPIGVFPWLMLLGVTLFFEPGWPRRFLGTPSLAPQPGPPLHRAQLAAWLVVVAVLALFPGRFVLYDLDVNWGERGYRLSWRVLLTEKTGFIEYRVVPADGRTRLVRPRHLLSEVQHAQLVGKPDLILQYGRHLGQVYGGDGVAVFADSYVSLNGSPSAPFINPDTDLNAPALDPDWILPRPARSAL